MANKALEERLEELFSDELSVTDPDRAGTSLEDALVAAFEPIVVDMEELGQLFAKGDLYPAPEADGTSTPRLGVDRDREPRDELWRGGRTSDIEPSAVPSEAAPTTGSDGHRSTQWWTQRLGSAWRAARARVLPPYTGKALEESPIAPTDGMRSPDSVKVLDDTHAALQRKVKYLQLGLETAKIAGLGLGLQASLDRAVELIQERLQTWHAAIFVLIEEGTYAVQQALAGRADPSELEKRRLLNVAADPVLAHCVETHEPWMFVAADRLGDAAEPNVSEGILLPRACSGVVLPLNWGDELLGVFTLQDTAMGAFGQEDLSNLNTVAAQITLLIAYTRASEEIEGRLRQVDALERDRVRTAWERFLPTWSRTQYEYSLLDDEPSAGKLAYEGETVFSDLRLANFEEESGGLSLVSTISLRDQIIGVLGLEGTPEKPWTEDETQVLTAISEQLGLVLENARLFENAQRRAERERQVREITARMRESLDVETVLRVAADEMYQALDLEEIVIQLATADFKGGLA